MRKSVLGILLAMVMLFGTVGCAKSAEKTQKTPGDAAAPEGAGKMKIAMMTTVAGLGDESFNDALLAGTKKYCDENGIELTIIEPQELQDFKNNAVSLGQKKYDMVFICENTINEMIREVAPQFPDTRFVLIEGAIDDMENVTSLQFRVQDAGFLCGAFATLMSESMGAGKTSGWVGGLRTPITEGTLFSTQAGAAYFGGECKFAFAGSYSDIAKGKEIALQMYNDGCAIVTAFAGATNSGIFQAAESFSSGKYAMGAGLGQFNLSPERIIASNVKAMDSYTYNACVDYVAGTLKSGIIIGGFPEGAIELRYSPLPAFEGVVPDEVKKQMEETTKKLVSGEIKAPANQEEYDAFIAGLK